MHVLRIMKQRSAKKLKTSGSLPTRLSGVKKIKKNLVGVALSTI
jgi:hypothetical protein